MKSTIMVVATIALAQLAVADLGCVDQSAAMPGAGSGGAPSGSGNATGAGGTPGAGGTTGSGGRTGTGGTTGAGTGGSMGTAPACDGAPALNPNPFGCTFAWGRQNPSGSGSLAPYNYLQAVAYWVEPGVSRDGTFSTCSGCNWLRSQVAPSTLIPVYYAYFIGYYGHANGLGDQNTNPGGPNLSTGGAALIKANRAKVIQMYASYAQQTRAAWPTKPLIWLLEGDFIQYTEKSQSSPLTMTELGQLAADITCAIKSNMPNAVVAINHSSWNANDETTAYWTAMKAAYYDMVWTTGVGNNSGYIESKGAPGYYNAATATYAYLRQATGRTIFVDTSYGASSMADTWSNLTASALNMHIANGVVAVNIPNGPSQQTLSTIEPQLSSTCH